MTQIRTLFTGSWVLCSAGPKSEETLQHVKDYIKQHGLTRDQVILVEDKDGYTVRVRNDVTVDLSGETQH
jgi:hypothetical protein